MTAKGLLGCLGMFAATVAMAAEKGELVVARRDVPLAVAGKAVDRVGPGQVLRVLEVNGTKLWVSRGRPGWIDAADVIPLTIAEAYFNRPFATGAGPRDYLSRGMVRIAMGKHDAGIDDLQRASELANRHSDYLEPLGYAQLAAQDHAAAIATFSRAISAAPQSAPAWMGRGLAYYQAGQNENAAADFSKAIALEPQHAFPRKYLGALLHDIGHGDAAAKELELAVKLDPHDAFTRKALGRLRFDQADYSGALEQFSIAVKLDRNDPEAIAGRGVVRHAIGSDLAAAEADFSAAIALAEQASDDAFLWSNLGQVQFERGRLREAKVTLDKAIELDPSFNEARSHRAYLRAVSESVSSEDIAAARSDVEAVFASSEPKTFWDYRALAAVNAAMNDFARAARHQAHAEQLVRASGPARFIELAAATRATYEEKTSLARGRNQ